MRKTTIAGLFCTLSDALQRKVVDGTKEVYVFCADENKEYHDLSVSLDIFGNVVFTVFKGEKKDD